MDNVQPSSLSIEEMLDHGSWRTLTSVEQKFQTFSSESYFRESWSSFVHIFKGEALPSIQRTAALALKPESILGRQALRAIEYMRINGFAPVAAEPFCYDRHKAREIWRFQWNIATLDRLRLGDLLHGSADSLLVLFVDTRPEDDLPASVRLAGLKGSSLPWERKEHHLRTHLGALNRMIVFVHCSDEPVDIIRELGVIVNSQKLDRLYLRLKEALQSREALRVEEQVHTLYKKFPICSLDVDSARRRIQERASTIRASERIEEHFARVSQGQFLSWRDWEADMTTVGLDPFHWDSILFGTHYIQHDHPDVKCIISESGRERWLAGEGISVGV